MVGIQKWQLMRIPLSKMVVLGLKDRNKMATVYNFVHSELS